MAKMVNIYRVDYEMPDRRGESWTAYIAAYSPEEARNYLGKFLNRNVLINTMSNESRLDAVSDEVRQVIARPILGTVNMEKKEEEEEKKPQKRSIVPPK
jgi:hypothetical protein